MKQSEAQKKEIVSARKHFFSMASTYCLGVFNDNFFKQAVLLVAVSTGLTHLQGPATVLFALPFLLFSSYAGWLADRFAKKNVVIATKAVEVLAMLIGGYGLVSANWNCILVMVFIMGAQSAFLSPALNGTIPELYPAHYVPKANAMLKLASTMAILAGISISGIVLDLRWESGKVVFSGKWGVAYVAFVVALAGLVLSFGSFYKKPKNHTSPFPWFGPLHSLQSIYTIRKDRQLFLALAADCFFYFLASSTVLAVNGYGVEQLGFSRSVTSLMSMSLMLGIAAGAVWAGKRMNMEKWKHYLIPSSLMMAVALSAAGCVVLAAEKHQAWLLAASLFTTGVSGGLFLIPVTSFLQVRPEQDQKGRVLGCANFCGFTAILLSGLFYTGISRVYTPSQTLLFLGLTAFTGSIFFIFVKISVDESGRPFFGRILRILLAIRYRIDVKGLHELELDKNKGTLFLPNHPALIDPVIVMSCLYRKFQPRPLSDKDQVNKPVIRQIMRLVKPIKLPSPRKNGRRNGHEVRNALQQVTSHLKRGEDILLYPSGRLYRSHNEKLASNSAVESIVKEIPDVQVVLIRTTGLWGSSFSWARAKEPSLLHYLITYFTSIVTGGLFFVPKRRVKIELKRDYVVASLSNRKVINAHLENYYNEKKCGNIHVPYYWWRGRQPKQLIEPTAHEQLVSNGQIGKTISLSSH